MFTHISIKNFRCLGSLQVKGLQRINLITGKNNSGKTSLLEAVQLHNSPMDQTLPVTINDFRGFSPTDASNAHADEWLIYDRHKHVGFEISTHDEAGIDRTYSLRFVSATDFSNQYPNLEAKVQANFRSDIFASQSQRRLGRFDQTGHPARYAVAFNTGGGSYSFTETIAWKMASIFVGSCASKREQDVNYFGKLEIAKRQDEVVKPLKILEPRLERLALIPFGTITAIHGDIGLPLLVPIEFMGEGMRRLLSILLALAHAKDGVLLIDEVENGFHYSVQKLVWQAIAAAARLNRVQVFATTHSWECIVRAHEAFAEGIDYDFCLHRLQRVENEIQVITHDREMLEAAIKTGVEMR